MSLTITRRYWFTSLLVFVFVLMQSPLVLAANDLTLPLPKQNTSDHIPALPEPIKPTITIPNPPDLNAKGYILIDANSGQVLAQKNPDQKLPPASLTKIMSSYLVADALKNGRITLDDKVNISQKAWRMGGSKMFIREGTTIPVSELIQGVIVVSGNDATVALAEHIAGSEEGFVDMMNQQAQVLGLRNTHFVDATGMPNNNHYSTARDLANLTRALITNFPEDYAWYKQKWYSWNNIKQPNRNRLLWRDPSVDGVKTGHTSTAGFCLVSSALRNNMRLIAVIMGTPSDQARTEDSQRLLDYGFRFYETHKIYTAQKPMLEKRIWMGKNKTIPVGLNHDLYVTIPKGQYNNLRAVLHFDSPIKAPINRNQSFGHVELMLNKKLVVERPIVALSDDPRGNIWRRFSDYISMSFHDLFNKSEQS